MCLLSNLSIPQSVSCETTFVYDLLYAMNIPGLLCQSFVHILGAASKIPIEKFMLGAKLAGAV